MGADTDVGMVAIGGACAFVLVWLIQWIAPTAPVTPELAVAFGTIFTAVFTYVLPRFAPNRSRRTRASSDEDNERFNYRS